MYILVKSVIYFSVTMFTIEVLTRNRCFYLGRFQVTESLSRETVMTLRCIGRTICRSPSEHGPEPCCLKFLRVARWKRKF